MKYFRPCRLVLRTIVCASLFLFVLLKSEQAPILFIEGNIGVGKSTFLNIIRQHIPQAIVTLEPCDEWQNISGHNLLQAFYQDGPRWAALFQIYASMTRIRKQMFDNKKGGQLQIVERSWYSDRYCFGQLMYDMNLMDDLSWHVYKDMWNYNVSMAQKPLCFVYVRTSPEICLKRMQLRSRGEETGVSLAYLTSLHEYHERLFLDKSVAVEVSDIPVLVLDGSLNFKDDIAVQQRFAAQILDFLKINWNIDLTK